MRKFLLLAALFVSQANALFAQGGLFEAPDTICARQAVQLKSNKPDAATHYWGFCSAYIMNTPTGANIGQAADALPPDAIEVAKDGDNYYAFVLSTSANAILRLDYGTSLTNIPKVTNYGNMDTVLPDLPNSLHIIKDSAKNNWHVFVSGGSSPANSSLARLDFGSSLGNIPNIVNFGNYNNILNQPIGLFVEKEGDNWYGFVMNRQANTLVRIEFGNNISFTPTLIDDVGGVPVNAFIFTPNDMTAVKDNGLWYFYYTNSTTNSIGMITMGNTFTNPSPTGADIGGVGVIDAGDNAYGITSLRDCDSLSLFITKKSAHEMVRISMPAATGPYKGLNFSKFGGMLTPGALSQFIRDRDNIYSLVPNPSDSTISRIVFNQCANTTIPYSTTNTPPSYYYDQPGLYNIYYAINEGKPDMQIQCRLIRVLPIPPMVVSNDTAICQGDTIGLRAISVTAQSILWSPNHNITNTSLDVVSVWPEYTVDYKIHMLYPFGCIVDTTINVRVNKVQADAGPDRILKDGETTVIGGPLTSLGTRRQYFYEWGPNQFINNRYDLTPVVNPPYDFTYYLKVTDSAQCVAIDTVVIRVECNDLNLPNAFAPETQGAGSKFGFANSQIVKLSSFTIYDRWGAQVFTTTDATHQWDGKVNGNDAPMGVYVWEADGFCTSGRRFNSSGNVTLIR